MKYYGTREGVEKPMQEAWKKEPVSEAQTKSLDRIVKELPEVKDTHEWEDYEKEPNQGNASEVIRWATEYQYQSGNADKYLQYIAERSQIPFDWDELRTQLKLYNSNTIHLILN